jgi:hypothetical protein
VLLTLGVGLPSIPKTIRGEAYAYSCCDALVTFALGACFGIWAEGKRGTAAPAANQAGGFAAVPGAVGSEDLTGPYEVVKGWPKDISTLPGNEKPVARVWN